MNPKADLRPATPCAATTTMPVAKKQDGPVACIAEHHMLIDTIARLPWALEQVITREKRIFNKADSWAGTRCARCVC
jgi:hypothetical protein